MPIRDRSVSMKERPLSVAIDKRTKERLELMARASRRSRKQQLAAIIELFYMRFCGTADEDSIDFSEFDNI